MTVNATLEQTIEKLSIVFANFGMSEQIVTDSYGLFSSLKFEKFLQKNEIQQIQTAPHHSALNGQAERTVQIFKNSMNNMRNERKYSTRGCRNFF